MGIAGLKAELDGMLQQIYAKSCVFWHVSIIYDQSGKYRSAQYKLYCTGRWMKFKIYL